MVAIDGRTGSRLWTRSVGAFGAIWSAGDTVFLVADDAKLMRIALATGQTLWEVQLPAYRYPDDREDPIAYSGPVLAGGRVLVTSSQGELLSFDALSGEAAGSTDIGSGSVTGPVVVAGSVYVLADDGTLYAFR